MHINLQWSDLKAFAVTRSVSIQYFTANNIYYLAAADGSIEVTAQIPLDGTATSDQTDFETNYKTNANQPLLPVLTTVTTQFEKTNKVLKLACANASVNSSGTAIASIKVPGTFGSGQGRYVLGGYAISADYNVSDTAACRIEDVDRNIAMMVALAINPAATVPVSDATIQGMGVITSLGQAFPSYPVVQSYTDDQLPSENQGWFFWPLATGSSTPPAGEVEINPIGGYGFIPAGFYIIVTYQRPLGVTSGSININLDWGETS